MKTKLCSQIMSAAVLILGAISLPAAAQTFPDRAIRMIYPFGAGSGSDSAWRAIALHAGAAMGQSIVVENPIGAGGYLGFQRVLNSPPDGYTIGIMTGAVLVTRPLADPKSFVEPGKDYETVAFGIEQDQVFVSHPSAPFKTFPEMIAYAKDHPGTVTVGHAGIGTSGHLTLKMLEHLAKVQLKEVPYNGVAPAMPDIMSGRVNAFIATGSLGEEVASGKLVGLATTGAERWDIYPKAPTLVELGYKDFIVTVWSGAMVPKGTPPAIISKLNDAIRTATKNPEVSKIMKTGGIEPRFATPAEFKEKILKEHLFWKDIIVQAGIKFD